MCRNIYEDLKNHDCLGLQGIWHTELIPISVVETEGKPLNLYLSQWTLTNDPCLKAYCDLSSYQIFPFLIDFESVYVGFMGDKLFSKFQLLSQRRSVARLLLLCRYVHGKYSDELNFLVPPTLTLSTKASPFLVNHHPFCIQLVRSKIHTDR